jgi:PKD repeat protein
MSELSFKENKFIPFIECASANPTPPLNSQNPSLTIINVTPSIQTVNSSDSFDFDIYCIPSQSVKAFEIQISFDPAIMHVQQVIEGTIFDGYSTFFSSGSIDNINGTVSNIFNLILGSGNVSTSGTLITVSCTAVSTSGYSHIILEDVGVTNETTYIPLLSNNGQITIHDPNNNQPHALFSFLNDTSSTFGKISFTDSSFDTDGSIVNRTWDFGDGMGSYMQHPRHQYHSNGSYLVTLTVMDNSGSYNTISNTIHITITTVKVTSINSGWNFISVPVNRSIPLSNLIIKKNESYYNWSEASSSNNPLGIPLIESTIFGWNRGMQLSDIVNSLNPGYGYWLYSYKQLDVSITDDPVSIPTTITTLKQKWNNIGIPYNQPVNKNDILINDTLWSQAVIIGWIDDNIFSWDSTSQTYTLETVFHPGKAYWLYAYQQCMMER